MIVWHNKTTFLGESINYHYYLNYTLPNYPQKLASKINLFITNS